MRRLDLGRRSLRFQEGLPAKQFRQVVRKLFALLDDPEPADSKQLAGFPYRRADVGEYRIVYTHGPDDLRIALIGKRNDGDVYAELKRLGRRE